MPADVGSVRYAYRSGRFIRFADLDAYWLELAAELAEQTTDEPIRLSPEFHSARWAAYHEANPARDHWLFDWLDVEPGRLLYHYTSAERLLDIAHSGALRLSALTSMRDPREFRDWSLQAFVVKGSGVNVEALHDAARRLRRGTKIVCFGRDRAPVGEPSLLDQFLNPQTGKGFLRPRMWEQYGAAHTGACLIFDRCAVDEAFAAHLSTFTEDPVLEQPHPFNGLVSYEDGHDHRLHAGQLGLIDQNYSLREWLTDPDWIREAFLTKDVDWMSEHEYRWGLMTSMAGSIDAPLLPGCLLGFVLGLEWKPAWTQVAEAFARQFAVPANVARLTWPGQALDYELVEFPAT